MEDIFDDEIPWQLTPLPTPVEHHDFGTPSEAGLLVMDIVQVEERLSSVEADLASYRELARMALDRLAEATKTNRVLQSRIRDLMGVVTTNDLGDRYDRGDGRAGLARGARHRVSPLGPDARHSF